MRRWWQTSTFEYGLRPCSAQFISSRRDAHRLHRRALKVAAMDSSNRWVGGNCVALLENGEEFFPRVFDAIRQAKREVIIETFILFEDKVGLELHAAMRSAAQRGVKIDVLIDGFGSPDLSREFVEGLSSVGVRMRVFDPGKRVLGQRLNVFRRMHRKIVVVDGERMSTSTCCAPLHSATRGRAGSAAASSKRRRSTGKPWARWRRCSSRATTAGTPATSSVST
jgi:phosphatidylserine/phosphatidylglycerophosphate/cardiolipin synthase-like enzyme